MDFDRDSSNTDEYFVTALQIFDCCGVESSGSLRVDALMDKFAPFVKTNKAEFSFLKTLLDPEQSNPDINVTKLATALHKYSENQKTKVDLEESFNLKLSGQAPQDSDSGISTDGLQLLEELQCELKEKEHLTHQLRNQLDFTDRQHEEALAALTAERDSLKRHLNMVREENAMLTHVRRDHDEACERLCASEMALADATRELDSLRKRARVYQEQVASLENDKLTLQELLSKSKDECHRINEMYAARQSALLEQNESLKAEQADLTSRFQDQEEFMQQIIKEKVLLEMELKDVLNKSNQTHLRLDRSIDVSYTEEQMLTALDTLNADSRFGQEHRLLDEESFISALKDDQGRATNMSLFDEIRLSFCNMSRQNIADYFDKYLDHSLSNNSIETRVDDETNEIKPYVDHKADFGFVTPVKHKLGTQEKYDDILKIIVVEESQTDNETKPYVVENKTVNNIAVTPVRDSGVLAKSIDTQTDDIPTIVTSIETQTDAFDIQLLHDRNKVQSNIDKLVSTGSQTIGAVLKKRPFVSNHRIPHLKPKVKKTIETQTEELLYNNNNHIAKCLECENSNQYTAKLEKDVQHSNCVLSVIQSEIAKYEDDLVFLQRSINEETDKNRILKTVVIDLNKKIDILEAECEKQADVIKTKLDPDMFCVDCQTDLDQTSVSTQVEVPCVECEKRNAVVPSRGLRKFLWDPIKCLFQIFAVICFLGAVCALCGVARRGAARCRTPWRWLHAQDIMDLLLRIEYTAEVPM